MTCRHNLVAYDEKERLYHIDFSNDLSSPMILDRHGHEAAYFFFIDTASLIFSSTDNCERLFLWNIIDIRESLEAHNYASEYLVLVNTPVSYSSSAS